MRYFAFSFLILCSSILFAQDDDRSIVRAYKTDKAPEIDGVISDGEWDAAGPPVLVAFDDVGTAFPDDPFGGPSDLSFQYRAMWEEPWTVYFLFEVTDDIAMEESPSNAWERDQIEFFMDGDDLEGSDDLPTYQWWDNEEIYGKFGASRWEGVFEGNTGAMSQFIEDLYEDGFGATAVSMVTEAEDSDNYTVEYAVSLEPMFDYGTFDGTSTGDAGQIVANETVTKFAVCISDDDNFGDGTVGRSHTVCSYRAFDGAVALQAEHPVDPGKTGPLGQVLARQRIGLALGYQRSDCRDAIIGNTGQRVRLATIGGGITVIEAAGQRRIGQREPATLQTAQ